MTKKLGMSLEKRNIQIGDKKNEEKLKRSSSKLTMSRLLSVRLLKNAHRGKERLYSLPLALASHLPD